MEDYDDDEYPEDELAAEEAIFGRPGEDDSNDEDREESLRRRVLPGSPQPSDASNLDSASAAGQLLAQGGAFVYNAPGSSTHYRSLPAQRSGGSAAGDSQLGVQADGMPRNQGRAKSPGFRAQECHVRHMPGFQEQCGYVLLGSGIEGSAPSFQQGCSGSSGWMMYAQAGVASTIAPVRAMCFNIPAECFSLDATKFTDWQTPMNNSVRVASIAALLGLVATPLSKGFVYVQLLSNSTPQELLSALILLYTLTVDIGLPEGPARTKRWRAPRPTRPTTRTGSAAAMLPRSSGSRGT